MDPRNAPPRAEPKGRNDGDPEAIDFVRFCYRRRRVGWPELYDEMWAVAGRGLYRGLDADDLGQIGIGFALYQMPSLATLVQRVVSEEVERRRIAAEASRTAYVPLEPAAEPEPRPAPRVATATSDVEVSEPLPRLVAVALGA